MRYYSDDFTYDRVVCSVCGKVVKGRLPREGHHVGDGSVVMPRRHMPAKQGVALRQDGSCWGYHEAADDYVDVAPA